MAVWDEVDGSKNLLYKFALSAFRCNCLGGSQYVVNTILFDVVGESEDPPFLACSVRPSGTSYVWPLFASLDQ